MDIIKIKYLLIVLFLLIQNDVCFAALENDNVLDDVLYKYQAVASSWADSIQGRAEWLFWLLVTISMVWTFGFMLLSKSDIGELFAEFIRFTIFVGFFWWLLINGPSFAGSIIDSLKQIASEATGSSNVLQPSSIVDIGFSIFEQVLSKSSFWSPVDTALGILISLLVLVVVAQIAVSMLVLVITAWFLAYAGVFFLGFGGSRWTSDLAINYYKTVLGIAVQLFTMILLVGIGQTILSQYYENMDAGMTFGELGIVLIVAITLLMLVDKVPAILSGIITGSSIGSLGAGSFGAGAAVGAAAAAAGVASTMLSSTIKQAAGGASAIMAAASEANASVSGSDRGATS